MSDSIVSMVFLGVLGLLFVLLVVLTIVLIATRKKGDEEEYEDDDSYDEYGYESENVNDDNYQNIYQDNDQQSDGSYDDDYDENTDDTYDDDYDENTSDAYDDDYDENTSDAYDDGYDENTSNAYDDDYDENTSTARGDDYDEDTSTARGDDYDENSDTAYDDYDENSNTSYDDNYADTSADNKEKLKDVSDKTYNNNQKQTSADNNDLNKATDKNPKEDVNQKAEQAADNQKLNDKAAVLKETSNVYEDEMGDYSDSAFAPYNEDDAISNEEAIMASVKEAEAMSEAVMYGKPDAETMFGIGDQLDSYKKKPVKRSTVSSNEEFYWYNKMDVAEKPSYKTKEMYYHYFNLPKDCIEDLLVEMYDCALVRTEEIRYIAYGIEPKAVSIKDILSEGNYYYSDQPKKKEPLPQDLIKIYEKWCGYVDKLFDKVEVHADEFTIQEIRKMLCEFGRNDVDVLLEGK